MPVWLDVNTRSGVPIYVQLVQQIGHAIEVGALAPGEQLPTVRQLANDLTIAPNTIVKAYNELQDMGLVDSRPGVGTIVAPRHGEGVRTRQVDSLYERLRGVVRDAASLGIEPADLKERFDAEVDSFFGQRSY